MKVAFASSRGTTVDEHFGRAGAFAIWEVTPEGADFVEYRRLSDTDLDLDVVTTRGLGAIHDDAVEAKIDKLADVRIVYCTEIGGPSAAKLIKRGVMPLKAPESTSIDSLAERLSETMRTRPTPWMRRVLAQERCRGPADQAEPEGPCACGSTDCC